jgi:GGDEF domain-containing protein
MPQPRRTSVAKLINRLLELPPCKGATAMGDHYHTLVKILEETVEADAFAMLQVHPGNADARILGGLGLRTPVDKWQMQVKTPCLAEWATNFPDVPAMAVEGPFAEDPFLGGEGAGAVLIKPVTAGEMYLVTTAFRRGSRSFTRSDVERFAAVSGVINLLESYRHTEEESHISRSTDKLTGLGFFSDFHETMVRELSRARRGGGTATMGIISVIPKGPVSADNVLLDLTRTFQDQLRNFDTLVRYGSMELAFILPDLRSAEGIRVVDRVMGEIISSLGGEGNAPDIYVGLSCYPEDGATVERLIEMAEAAMSLARDESRPGVYRWSENGDQ